MKYYLYTPAKFNENSMENPKNFLYLEDFLPELVAVIHAESKDEALQKGRHFITNIRQLGDIEIFAEIVA